MSFYRLALLGSIIPLAASIALFIANWAFSSTEIKIKKRMSLGASLLLASASALATGAHMWMAIKIYFLYKSLDVFLTFLFISAALLLFTGLFKATKRICELRRAESERELMEALSPRQELHF